MWTCTMQFLIAPQHTNFVLGEYLVFFPNIALVEFVLIEDQVDFDIDFKLRFLKISQILAKGGDRKVACHTSSFSLQQPKTSQKNFCCSSPRKRPRPAVYYYRVRILTRPLLRCLNISQFSPFITQNLPTIQTVQRN